MEFKNARFSRTAAPSASHSRSSESGAALSVKVLSASHQNARMELWRPTTVP